ncbi:hypothetical protein [Frankia sp. CiP3]|uniref:hypothetical protein n=1 Tax=Frankia sp. CiP3 TaxID=2880971 RepID=UPI001EF72567|nr:hypothetical protein [Frankia sp. CiP3]
MDQRLIGGWGLLAPVEERRCSGELLDDLPIAGVGGDVGRQSMPLTDQPPQLRPVTKLHPKVLGIEPNNQSPDLDIFYSINNQIS